MARKFTGKTHIAVLIDKSGSMAGKESEVVSGFNQWKAQQSDLSKDTEVSVVLFDTAFIKLITNTPLADVRDLVPGDYMPGGFTALYDAMGKVISDLRPNVRKKDRALVIVITDGLENSSKEYYGPKLREYVTELEGKGNWTFTYLSSNPFLYSDAKFLGMTKANTLTVSMDTPRDVTGAFAKVSTATRSYLGGAVGQTATFYDGIGEDTD